MEKKWIEFIGIFAVIWATFIVLSLLLVYFASITENFTYNEFWITYFAGFLIITTSSSGIRLGEKNSHSSYIFILIIFVGIAVLYYLLTLYVIIPWAESVGWI